MELITETQTVKKAKCWRCGYTWEPVVLNPKKCPRCQTRQEKFKLTDGTPSAKRNVPKVASQTIQSPNETGVFSAR